MSTVTLGAGNNTSAPPNTKIHTVGDDSTGRDTGVVIAHSDGSGGVVESDGDGLKIKGTAALSGHKSGSKTVTTANDSTSSATLISANADRTGFSIVNTSSARLYVAAGGTASATNLFVALSQWQECSMYGIGVWTGDITGVWASDPGDGVAVCTEFEE